MDCYLYWELKRSLLFHTFQQVQQDSVMKICIKSAIYSWNQTTELEKWIYYYNPSKVVNILINSDELTLSSAMKQMLSHFTDEESHYRFGIQMLNTQNKCTVTAVAQHCWK